MIIAIVGPTASGKTAASIEAAHQLGSSGIVGADAMQLYRGMDIGTAKATLAERRGIPHYQIDVLDLHEEASVAAYQKHARADLESLENPVLVGGSGLYVSAVLDAIDFPGTDPALRAKYTEMHSEIGDQKLHELLAKIDPASAEVIDPRNSRRVIRALEVNELTGQSFQPRFPRHTPYYEDIIMVGLRLEPQVLKDRIAKRTESMFADGLLEETAELRRRGLDDAPTARTATGYREAIDVLDGRMSIEEAKAGVSDATWKLVRKQMTWFRRDPRITWVDGGVGSAAAILDKVGS